MKSSAEKQRCPWPATDPLMIAYHDTEWGVPVHDDQKIYEFLVLETFQAGLSWRTVLHKRENFRKAFRDFDVRKVARMDAPAMQRLLGNAGIKARLLFSRPDRRLRPMQAVGMVNDHLTSCYRYSR